MRETISNVLAPGARVEIRGAEWIIRRVDTTSTGGQSVLVTGVSEIVRGKESRFLTEIEGKGIVVLEPAETVLVPDASPQFRDTRLYLESLFRQSPPTGADLYIGHGAAIDELPFQLEPALQALEQPRQRILMADAMGLGKTIEVGILLAELIRRGKGRRILAVTSKAMMIQFQKELWSRFTIPLVRLDSVGIQRVRARIPTNANPFHHFDRTIISIDTLKQESEYRVYLENAWWDVIVIDEAHNVAERGDRASFRSRLARLLATRSDTLIMTSATPHDGRAESFASLMNMLDPTAIADPKSYGPEDIKGLYLRRFKKDVQAQVALSFKERKVVRAHCTASAEEERAFERLMGMTFLSFDRRRKSGQHLFRTVLEKALFSSPAACLQSTRERLRKLEGDTSDEAQKDRDSLHAMEEALVAIGPKEFSRYQKLLQMLRSPDQLDWKGSDPKDRLVIFTERIETLKFLKENLVRDLGIPASHVATLYGQDATDVEQQQVVEDFGREKAPVRLLLATDIASEGINLHYLCHKMVHFDVPWSLMVFQQRNGRIDRYGQEKQPHIAYLYVESRNERIRGDARILQLLEQKDAEAQKNIGDPTAFYGVYDEREEERITAQAIEDGLTPEQLEKRVAERKRKQNDTARPDLMAILFGGTQGSTIAATGARKRQMPSLFADDMTFVRQAIDGLRGDTRVEARFDAERNILELTVDDSVRHAFKNLPSDALPESGEIWLTTDRQRVTAAIRACRSEDRKWPDVHLLWDLHPFMEWMGHRLLVAFQRREAPVVVLPGPFEPGEALFLFQGEIPNLKGHPAVHAWFATQYSQGQYVATLSLQQFLERTGFGKKALANPAAAPNLIPLQSLLPDAVARARSYMSDKRKSFQEFHGPALSTHLEKLKRLKERQTGQLDLDFPDGEALRGVRRAKKEERGREIDRVFDEHVTWVRETMTVEDRPFLRVAALFLAVDR